MPPKKKQAQASKSTNRPVNGGGKNEGESSKSKAKNKGQQNKTNSKKKKVQADLDFYSDIDKEYNSGQSKPNRSLILGKENGLKSLFSSSQSKETKPANDRSNTAVFSPSSSTANRSFEEDEGFIYKRSQEVDNGKPTSKPKPKPKTSKAKPSNANNMTTKLSLKQSVNGKKRPISTPLARLQQETANLSVNEDDSIHFEDVEETIKPPSKTNGKAGSNLEPQLSSPIRSPSTYKNYSNAFDDDHFSSDGYSEEVSHHKIELAPESPPSPPIPRPTTANLKKRTKHSDTNRTTKRRASYHNRGKRILSIGNGYVGEPHEQIDPKEYYKFLDDSMPDPNRMRQLLVWCFKKTLQRHDEQQEQQSPSAETVKGITKVIGEEFLEGLTNGKISTSWYNRQDDDDQYNQVMRPVVPNPLNESNEENIKIFEDKLIQLQQEKREWHQAYKDAITPVSKMKLSLIEEKDQSQEDLRDYLKEKVTAASDVDFNSSILDESLLKSINKSWQDVKDESPNDLESSVDKLYNTSFQVQKASELVQTVQNNNISGKVSNLFKKFFVSRNDMINYKSDSHKSQFKSPWPVPPRPITTHELLRGISKIDNPIDNTPNDN